MSALEFYLDLWHQQTSVRGLSYGFVCVILCLVVLVQYRRMSDRQTDGQTDKRTHDDSIYRASIVSRGKKPLQVGPPNMP